MVSSLKVNKERIKQRRREVMEATYRARNFTSEQLTKEAANFIEFCLSLEKIRKKREKERNK